MIEHRCKRRRQGTLGDDKAYDLAVYVNTLRDRRITPRIAIDGYLTKTG